MQPNCSIENVYKFESRVVEIRRFLLAKIMLEILLKTWQFKNIVLSYCQFKKFYAQIKILISFQRYCSIKRPTWYLNSPQWPFWCECEANNRQLTLEMLPAFRIFRTHSNGPLNHRCSSFVRSSGLFACKWNVIWMRSMCWIQMRWLLHCIGGDWFDSTQFSSVLDLEQFFSITFYWLIHKIFGVQQFTICIEKSFVQKRYYFHCDFGFVRKGRFWRDLW